MTTWTKGEAMMSDYFDGYDAGMDAGWGAGKTKAYQEVLNRLQGPYHAKGCGCRPCLVIRACRGEIDVARAMNSIFDIDEEDEPAETAGVECPSDSPKQPHMHPWDAPGG